MNVLQNTILNMRDRKIESEKSQYFIASHHLKNWNCILEELNHIKLSDFDSLDLDDYPIGVLVFVLESDEDLDFAKKVKGNFLQSISLLALSTDFDLLKKGKNLIDDFIFAKEQAFLLEEKIEKLLHLKIREFQSSLAFNDRHNRLKDQELARHIQKMILQETPPYLPNLDIEVNFITSDIIGGDLWDFQVMSNGHVGIFLGDVSGHGIGAALIASMTKIIFKTFAREVNNPKWFLTRLNEIMVDILMPVEQFITAFYGIYKDGSFRYVNAGHIPPLIYSPSKKQFKELYNTSCIVGYTTKIPMEIEEVFFEKGDLLLLFTDGLVEACNKDRQMYGTKRLKAFIEENYNQNPFGENILHDLKKFCESEKLLEDDITLIVLRVRQ